MSYAFRVAVRHHYGTTVKLSSKEPYQVYKIAPKGWYFTDKYKMGMKTMGDGERMKPMKSALSIGYGYTVAIIAHQAGVYLKAPEGFLFRRNESLSQLGMIFISQNGYFNWRMVRR